MCELCLIFGSWHEACNILINFYFVGNITHLELEEAQLKLAAALAIVGMGFSGFAAAEQTTGNAQATLLTTISFVEDQVVDFKTIPNGTGTCEMNMAGVLSNHCAGSPDGTPGQFTISGTAAQVVDITVGNGSTDNNVTFAPKLDNLGATTGTATLDGSGDATIAIAGDLTLSAAAGGARALTYDLTVNYQ